MSSQSQPDISVPEAKQHEQTKEAPKLAPLSPQDFKVYNKHAEHMNMFHNHFRHTWKMMEEACTTNRRAQGQSIRGFINAGLQFCSQIEMHHGIEESYIFPMLAKKMPEFSRQDELVAQHKVIHKGLDQLQDYLEKCKSGEKELRMSELKVIMDSFGGVLWQHLDQEVETLGAENMRKYWTKEEIQRMVF